SLADRRAPRPRNHALEGRDRAESARSRAQPQRRRGRGRRTARGRRAACRPRDRRSGRASASILAVLLSYCVGNTNGREDLLACLDAIERTTPGDLEHEVLVLDNASDDGSAEAVRALDREIRLIELDRRVGKAENDSRLLREAQGEYCLLLNEDSEL